MEQKEELERLEGPREMTTRSDGSDSNGSEKKQGRRMGERLEETHNNQTHM
jgi:hypothetical protein